MSWFSLFGGTVIFGDLRVCDNSLDFDITSNAFGYFTNFPDSTCIEQPSQVFSSDQCWTNTTTPLTFQAGCPDQPLYDLDFKYREYLDSLSTNFSLNASWGCESFYMERNASGYTVVLTDNVNASGCSGSVTVSSTSSTSSSSTISSPTTTLTSTSLTTSSSTSPSSVTTSSSIPSESPTTTPSAPPSSSPPPPTLSPVSPSLETTRATSTTSPAVFVGAATRVRGPSSGMLFSVLLFILYTIISPVLCLLDSAAAEAVNPKDAPIPRNIPTGAIRKRIPIDDFADIAAFGPPLAAVLQTNLPVPSGDPNPLTSYIASANNNVCRAGRNNLAMYGANWTTTPGKHLLGQMLADCVTSFDQVSLDTYIYATTQSPTEESEEGVIFFKFVGALYCNRLIVTLVKDPANLDMICNL